MQYNLVSQDVAATAQGSAMLASSDHLEFTTVNKQPQRQEFERISGHQDSSDSERAGAIFCFGLGLGANRSRLSSALSANYEKVRNLPCCRSCLSICDETVAVKSGVQRPMKKKGRLMFHTLSLLRKFVSIKEGLFSSAHLPSAI